MIILVIVCLIGALFLIALYSCLVVASREDDAMEKYFENKEKPSN